MDVSCVVVPAFVSVGCSRVRIGRVIVIARAGPRVRVCVCFGATVNGEAIIPPAVLMDARFFRLRHSPEGAGFNLSRNTTSLQEAQPARLGQWRCRRAFGKNQKKQKKPKPIFRFSPALTLQWSGNAVPRSKLALISRVCSPNARSIFRLKCSFLSLMCVTSFSS